MPRRVKIPREPTLPARRSSLHRQSDGNVADFDEFIKARDSIASTSNTHASGEASQSNSSSSSNSSQRSRSHYSDVEDSRHDMQIVGVEGGGGGGGKEDDELIYVLKRDIVARLVPMDVETELVPFEQLPEEVQRQPTTILTWARQTPEFLYLETFVPPQCKVCLEQLESRMLLRGNTSKAIEGGGGGEEEEEEEAFFATNDDTITDLIPKFTNLLIPTPGLDIPGAYPWGTAMA